MAEPSGAVLVHFYRAVVGHMDVWRQRMDATTNWAAATSAGMITFAFGSAVAPHYVLLVALAFQGVFLLMEARRYQTFDLWRHRFRMLNRALIVPTLQGNEPDDEARALYAKLARDMGRTVPHMSVWHAAGYRIRRNYGYLFTVTALAWLMKIELQPSPTSDAGVFVMRAAVAFVPGALVLAVVGAAAVLAAVLVVHAPTHDIVDWEASVPRPLWRSFGRRRRRTGDAEGDHVG